MKTPLRAVTILDEDALFDIVQEAFKRRYNIELLALWASPDSPGYIASYEMPPAAPLGLPASSTSPPQPARPAGVSQNPGGGDPPAEIVDPYADTPQSVVDAAAVPLRGRADSPAPPRQQGPTTAQAQAQDAKVGAWIGAPGVYDDVEMEPSDPRARADAHARRRNREFTAWERLQKRVSPSMQAEVATRWKAVVDQELAAIRSGRRMSADFPALDTTPAGAGTPALRA